MEKFKKEREDEGATQLTPRKKSPKITVSDKDVAIIMKRLKLPPLARSSKLDCVGSQNSKISFEAHSP